MWDVALPLRPSMGKCIDIRFILSSIHPRQSLPLTLHEEKFPNPPPSPVQQHLGHPPHVARRAARRRRPCAPAPSFGYTRVPAANRSLPRGRRGGSAGDAARGGRGRGTRQTRRGETAMGARKHPGGRADEGRYRATRLEHSGGRPRGGGRGARRHQGDACLPAEEVGQARRG